MNHFAHKFYSQRVRAFAILDVQSAKSVQASVIEDAPHSQKNSANVIKITIGRWLKR